MAGQKLKEFLIIRNSSLCIGIFIFFKEILSSAYIMLTVIDFRRKASTWIIRLRTRYSIS